MRTTLSIKGITPTITTDDSPPETKDVASSPTATTSSVSVAPIHPNPALRLEPALGLVVIEFRNSSGEITTSIPSQRQLQAYKAQAISSTTPVPGNSPSSFGMPELDGSRVWRPNARGGASVLASGAGSASGTDAVARFAEKAEAGVSNVSSDAPSPNRLLKELIG